MSIQSQLNIWQNIFYQKEQEQRGRITEVQQKFLKHKKKTMDSCDRLFAFLDAKFEEGELHPLKYLRMKQGMIDHWEFRLLKIAGEKEVRLGIRGKMVRFYEYVVELLQDISVEDRAKFFDYDQQMIDWILEKRENWIYRRCYSLLNNTLKCNYHEHISIFNQGNFYFIVKTID